MNSDHLTQLLQQGFRVTLGATASLVETLQDPQKRSRNLSDLRSELDHLTQEWAEKGEVTEQEARNFVDTLLNQLSNQPPSPPSTPSPATVVTTPTQRSAGGSCVEQAQTTSPAVQLELQELTAQIAAMRKELEQLRNQDSNPA